MFDNFTDSTKELIFSAQNIAMQNHNTLIEPVHILYSMANSSIENVVSSIGLPKCKVCTHCFDGSSFE